MPNASLSVATKNQFGGEDSGSFVNGVLGKIASGRKEGGEIHRAHRQTHQAKIIIRSSKKTADTQEESKNAE